MARKIIRLLLDRADFVDMGANPHAHVMLFKRAEKAEWTAAFINGLPDGSFAVVLPGGQKDEEGKTVPRALRKLPFKDARGRVDLPHLRNALARLPQADMPAASRSKARRALEAAARAAGIGGREEKRMPQDTKDKDLEIQLTQAQEAQQAAEQRATEAEKQVTTLEKRVAELEAAQEKSPEQREKDKLAKADPEVKKALDELRKRADEAEKRLQEKLDKDALREAQETVRKWDRLPGVTVDDHAPLIRELRKVVAEQAAQIEEILEKANAAIRESTIFDELGSGAENVPTDAEGKLEAAARTVQKRDGVTYAQAFAKAVDENPELYQRYVKERDGRER